MRKRQYEKPSMKVYELKKQPTLLVGSPAAGLQNYYMNDEGEE